MAKVSEKESFNQNYKVLKEIAEKLRSQESPDIDQLVPMVEKASKAYQNCKSRLDSVKKALAEHLPENS